MIRLLLITGFFLAACCEMAQAEPSFLESGPGAQVSPLCDCCPLECCDCSAGDRVLGFLPSDHCFDSFISPLSNPFFFEDPRSLTEARAIFLDNKLPSRIDDSNLQVWSGQVRGRISDRLSVIAP